MYMRSDPILCPNCKNFPVEIRPCEQGYCLRCGWHWRILDGFGNWVHR